MTSGRLSFRQAKWPKKNIRIQRKKTAHHKTHVYCTTANATTHQNLSATYQRVKSETSAGSADNSQPTVTRQPLNWSHQTASLR